MTARTALIAACTLLLALSGAGQTLHIGPDPATTNAGAGPTGVNTYVDLTVPAPANGTVTSARFTWPQACPNALNIKFFHRTGNTLTLFAERGPFSTTGALDTVAITPPVTVQTGDLIGLVQLTSCGNPTALAGTGPAPGYLFFTGNVTTTATTTSGSTIPNTLLAIGGTGAVISGANIPAMNGALLALLALVFMATGYVALRR